MIDAISIYSSTHECREKNPTLAFQGMQKIKEMPSDIYINKRVPKKQSELGSFLFLTGCFASFSLIADILVNSDQLAKSDYHPVKDILKFAGIWALIGASLFGFFKAIEHAANEKISK